MSGREQDATTGTTTAAPITGPQATPAPVFSPTRTTRRYVVKRDGRHQEMRFDKVTDRLVPLCEGLNPTYIDPSAIAQSVFKSIHSGIRTAELDEIAAEKCAYNAFKHPDFSLLGGRLCVSNLHKQTSADYAAVVRRLYAYVHPKTGEPAPKVSKELHDVVQAHAEAIQAMFDFDRDYLFDFFGFQTLARSYLIRVGAEIVERPQMMFMRVALWLHGADLPRVRETYDLMSQHYFTHATPTLFNAGTVRPQASSCFLLATKEDSIGGIYDTLKTSALISKYAGGVGMSIHNVRATKSYIRGTQGVSNGIVPMLRVFNDSARYVDQGGGRRKGSNAIYLEPWHADVEAFLSLKKNFGKEEFRARDLFYALWIPDLFMRRVLADEDWSLFCPNEAPGLCDTWGDAFDALYAQYEAEGRARKTLPARVLFHKITESQMETGVPYMLYKDAANRTSNQQHLGTIRSSNLCTEIIEYTSAEEVAVCNLASVCLNKFVVERPAEEGGGAYYDHAALVRVVRVIIRNLNTVIDKNFYPVEEARRSNMRHRPVGLGVQGFADAVAKMRWSFDGPEARAWNREVFESIYYGAVTESIELARLHGPYPSYAGSPASRGQLQFDLWGLRSEDLSGRYDWAAVKADLAAHGLRNSLLTALMPTASTAQIFGNNEAFEPFTSNLYNRRVLAGEFPVINRHLVAELCDRGLWTPETRMLVMAASGSVQHVPTIPEDVKARYRTVWEIPQRSVVEMSRDRAPFICQSQSLNIHLPNPTTRQLDSLHATTWRLGLVTGMYYLRTQKEMANKYTVDPRVLAKVRRNAIATIEEEGEDPELELGMGGGDGVGGGGDGVGGVLGEEGGDGDEDDAIRIAEDADVCISCGS